MDIEQSMTAMLKCAGILDKKGEIVKGGDPPRQLMFILPWLRNSVLSGDIVADKTVKTMLGISQANPPALHETK